MMFSGHFTRSNFSHIHSYNTTFDTTQTLSTSSLPYQSQIHSTDTSFQTIIQNSIYTSNSLDYVVAFAGTQGYISYIQNMICTLRRVGIYHPLLLALDEYTFHHFQHPNTQQTPIPVVYFPDSTSQQRFANSLNKKNESLLEPFHYNTAQFKTVSNLKIYSVYKLLQLKINVLFTDSDISFCDSAHVHLTSLIQTLEKYKTADLIIQSDLPGNFLCTGFYFVRSSPQSIHFFEQLLNMTSGDDQARMNALLCSSETGGKRMNHERCMSKSGFIAQVLPQHEYTNGAYKYKNKRVWYYSRERVMDWCRIGNVHGRMILHNNHIWPGNIKKDRMITQGLWYFDEQQQKCLDDPQMPSRENLLACNEYCLDTQLEMMK